MTTKSRIKSMFSNSAVETRIIDSSLKFKEKLNLSDDAYTYLKKAKNLQDFLHIVSGGGSVAAVTYFGWAGSLGLAGKLGLAVGIVSAPIGLIALAGGVGAASLFAVNKFTKKIDDDAYIKIPKFINSPLDILALDILQTILPISLKVALSDGNFASSERMYIIEKLHSSWGFNRDFVSKELDILTSQTKEYSYSDLNNYLEEKFSSNKDVNLHHLKSFLVEISEGIINSDNRLTSAEIKEIENLRHSLQLS